MACHSPPQEYACACLNVHIISSQSPASSPEGSLDPAYAPVFVSDDGITIIHPQITVRTTTHAEPIPGTSRYSRFSVLSCLLCGLPIYRVLQAISLDVQGKESILFPTDDWVEHDILKSATGWIQVHKDSLIGDSISQAKWSPLYSMPFSLLLPPSSSPPSSSPNMNTETFPSNSTDSPTQTYLSQLRPLFFPPPFTPSHLIFAHLASVANNESQQLRGAAEQRIADFVKAETAGIDAREQELRRQVEVLWKTYRGHLSAMQQAPNIVRSPASRSGGIGLVAATNSFSSVTIRSFDPVPIPTAVSPPSSVPRVSALSVSLATSTFHHPNVIVNNAPSRSPAHSFGSYGSASSRTLSTHSRSSTLVPDVAPVAGSNVLQFRRNINDTINTQASYKYFVNLEEDMARYKRSQEEAMKEQQEAEAAKRAQRAAGPSQTGSKTNGNLKSKTVQTTRPQISTEISTGDESATHEETILPRGRDKGKRKVTFDVEPVITTKTADDGNAAEGVIVEPDPREMVFVLEDLESEEDQEDGSKTQHCTLPLLEQPVSRPPRPRKTHQQNNIEIFASLRPSSLPNPSHIRPMRGQPHVDSSQVVLPRPKVSTTFTPGSPPPALRHEVSPKATSEHDAELLRLVAADTPSHRGAWTPNSRAWQTFTRRQDSREDLAHSGIPEEGEEETDEMNLTVQRPPEASLDHPIDDDHNVASISQSGSLPISIVIRTRPHEPLSLASYQPQTAIGDVPHGEKIPSSTTIRKAKYAERDRSRSMDPGALDFATEDDAEEMEGDQIISETQSAGERGRKHALKILKARSELPEAGMWRSLA